eukprot:scaffold3119_cov123-Skeletonema_marinoi.AAC.1
MRHVSLLVGRRNGSVWGDEGTQPERVQEVPQSETETTPFYPRMHGGKEPSYYEQPEESFAAFNPRPHHGEAAQAQDESYGDGSAPFFGESESTGGKAPRKSDHEEAYAAYTAVPPPPLKTQDKAPRQQPNANMELH